MECSGKLRGEQEGTGVARANVIIRIRNHKHRRTCPVVLEEGLAWFSVRKAKRC